MIRFIDKLLNDITMYRVVLYGLFFLAAVAFVFSTIGILYYKPLQLFVSLVILLATCYASNVLLASFLKAPTNNESSFITALILFFIFMPVTNMNDAITVFLAGIIAMASKYILALHKKHIFNPAAFAAFFLGFLGNGNALWWVGSDFLLPFVIVIGLLIVRKIRRFRLFFSFLFISVISIAIVGVVNGIAIQKSILESFTSWPLLFFSYRRTE